VVITAEINWISKDIVVGEREKEVHVRRYSSFAVEY
jgi:hypothetical protein